VPRDTSYDRFASLRAGDLASAAARHRRSAVVITLLLIPLFVVGIWLIPAEYNSQGQLLVRLGRGSVSMDPTTSLTQTVSLQESRASQVNSVKQMLSSRELSQRVVDRVGAERIMEPHSRLGKFIKDVRSTFTPPAWLSSKPEAQGEMTAEELEAHAQREAACKEFESMYWISSPPDAYTIYLEISSGSPFLSRDLLNAVMQEYQGYHVEAHQSTGSVTFFETQTDLAFDQAIRAKETLKQAKTERGIIGIEAAQSSLHELISQTRAELLSTESQIAAVRSESEHLRRDIAMLPAEIKSETVNGIPRATGDSMRQSLYDLEVRYKELTSKLKPGHPKLGALKEQLSSSAEIAASEVGDRPQTRQSINPIRQQLELTLRTTTSQLAGLEAKKASLEHRSEELSRQLARLNADEVDLAKLDWQASLAESDYLRAAENRDRAKQIAAMDLAKVGEISVVQPATLELKKTKPKRALLSLLAIALAGSLGIGQAILRGLRHPTSPSRRTTRRRQPVPIDGDFDAGHPDDGFRSAEVREDGGRAVDVDESSFTGAPR